MFRSNRMRPGVPIAEGNATTRQVRTLWRIFHFTLSPIPTSNVDVNVLLTILANLVLRHAMRLARAG